MTKRMGFWASISVVLLSAAHSFSAVAPTVPSGLFINGNPHLNPALALIESARNSIDIEIYEMEDTAVIEALRSASARGRKIRIIKDPYPVPKRDQCLWFPGLKEREHWPLDTRLGVDSNENAMPNCARNVMPMIEEITKHGGQVVPFYKPKLCGPDEDPSSDVNGCYEHGKLILVDGDTALVSTGNLNPSNFCDSAENPVHCDRDFSFVTRDSKEVSVYRSVFEKDLKQTRYALHPIVNPASSAAPTVTVSPYSLDPLVNFIRTRATGAGHTLQIENQYLNEPNLNAAIQNAAKSGAHVEVMVSSLCAFARPNPNGEAAARDAYHAFAQAGVHFKYFPSRIEIEGKKGYLHAKAIVIDGKYAWMGSVNGSHSALSVNREFGLFFSDPQAVELLSRTLKADFNHPAAESFEQSWNCQNDEF